MRNKQVLYTLMWVSFFSIAMGYLESAVVVYLRKILYNGGFDFPLKVLEMDLAVTELLREAATLVMMVGIGMLAGKKPMEKLAWFIYTFAIWDIFYYVFLKLLLGWPESLLDWDVLFLIPVTWVGPVVAPVILACLMIVLAFFIIDFSWRLEKVRIARLEWSLLIVGSLVSILSFTYDYMAYVLDHYTFKEVLEFSSREGLMDLALEYIPERFLWWVFVLGASIIALGITLFHNRNKKRLASVNTTI